MMRDAEMLRGEESRKERGERQEALARKLGIRN